MIKARARLAWRAYLAHPWAPAADALIAVSLLVWWLV